MQAPTSNKTMTSSATSRPWLIACSDREARPAPNPTHDAPCSALGSGGTVVLRFEAAGRGETELRLSYLRTWEQGVPPLKTFAVTVGVQ
jgi:predicted secreted protein